MYTAIHVKKKNGSIARLTLADTQGERIEVTKDELKDMIRNGTTVYNARLTPGGRLKVDLDPGKKYMMLKSLGINYQGKQLYRVVALRDIMDIKAGTLGGCIEKKSNLSMTGKCWIGYDVIVTDKAVVKNNAIVDGFVTLTQNAVVGDWARIKNARGNIGSFVKIGQGAFLTGKVSASGNAQIMGCTIIDGDKNNLGTEVKNNGDVSPHGSATVMDNTKDTGGVRLSDNVIVEGRCMVWGNVNLCGNAIVTGCAIIDGDTTADTESVLTIKDNARIDSNAAVAGQPTIQGFAYIGKNAVVTGKAVVSDERVENREISG